MKIAIVHDYLNQLGGAERVVGVLHEMFPQAPIYTLLVDHDKLWPSLHYANIIPSRLQKSTLIRWHFKRFFWLYPFIISRIDLSDYDLVITSSSAYAKGVRTKRTSRGAFHICYCHTPMRFAWFFKSYITKETSNPVLKLLARMFLPALKAWDYRNSKDVDVFVANSNVVKDRIRDIYHRDSIVIFPPVETSEQSAGTNTESDDGSYFLVVSRLVSYKRIDLAVKACSIIGKRLIVVGEGPDLNRLHEIAGPSVDFWGWQSSEVVSDLMTHCNALIFPGEEDFGITPVECNLHGRPVVAFKGGGALDTILHQQNGIFFSEQTSESLIEALAVVSEVKWDSSYIRKLGERFKKEVFVDQIMHLVDRHGSEPIATLDGNIKGS